MIDWDSKVIGPCLSVFGKGDRRDPEPIFYTSARDGSVFWINGIFDEAHEQIEVDDGVPISSVSPVLGVRLSAFPCGSAPKQRDTFILDDVKYQVGDVQPDGHGWALLVCNLLEQQP